MPGSMSDRADRFVEKFLGHRLSSSQAPSDNEKKVKPSDDLMHMLNRHRRKARMRRRSL